MTNPVGSTIHIGDAYQPDAIRLVAPPLPANHPWVHHLSTLFPRAPLEECMAWAADFQRNMSAYINTECSKLLRKQKETARKFKEAIRGG